MSAFFNPYMSKTVKKMKATNQQNQAAIDHLYNMSTEEKYKDSQHMGRTIQRAMSSLSKCPHYVDTTKKATDLHGVGPAMAREIMKVVAPSSTGKITKMKAQEPENQVALDYLYTLSTQEKYEEGYMRFNIKKAMDSLSKCPHYVDTTKKATDLHGVGSALAKEILKVVPHSSRASSSTSTSTNNSKRAKSTTSTASTKQANNNNASEKTAAKKTRKRKDTQKNNDGPPQYPKEKAHINATNESIGILTRLNTFSQWKVILLIDGREHKSDDMESKMLQKGVECEVRHLPIGDFLWIARGFSKSNSHEKIELVLGTIIERKTISDLKCSLHGTRFTEQRLRLKNSFNSTKKTEGITGSKRRNQILYLVEGTDLSGNGIIPEKTVKYAMMSTRIHAGFSILQTKHLEDTCVNLKRIHQRIIQRTFPNEISGCTSTGKSYNALLKKGFSEKPLEPFGNPRHTLWNEFKTKIELDREVGTKSINAVFRAQLKQVDSFSVKKVEALTKNNDEQPDDERTTATTSRGITYQTPIELVDAYYKSEESQLRQIRSNKRRKIEPEDPQTCEKMVEKVPMGRLTIGPKSSVELYHVYMTGGKQSKIRKDALKGDIFPGEVDVEQEDATKKNSNEQSLARASSVSLAQTENHKNNESEIYEDPHPYFYSPTKINYNTVDQNQGTKSIDYNTQDRSSLHSTMLSPALSLAQQYHQLDNSTNKAGDNDNSFVMNSPLSSMFSPTKINFDDDHIKTTAYQIPQVSSISNASSEEKKEENLDTSIVDLTEEEQAVTNHNEQSKKKDVTTNSETKTKTNNNNISICELSSDSENDEYDGSLFSTNITVRKKKRQHENIDAEKEEYVPKKRSCTLTDEVYGNADRNVTKDTIPQGQKDEVEVIELE